MAADDPRNINVVDENADDENVDDEPKQISRRALLKELGKAPGVMGALMIPTYWVTPLMEFTLGTGVNRCSATTGDCTNNALSLAFGSSNTVTWTAAWYGLMQGSAITAVLDPTLKKVRVTLAAPFSFGALPVSSVATLGADGLSWSFTDGTPTPVILSVTMANGIAGTTCSYNAPPVTDPTVSFSMDLLVTGTQATGYTLVVKNFHSNRC